MTRTPIAVAEFDTEEECKEYSHRNPDVICKLRKTDTEMVADQQKILFKMVERLGSQVSYMDEILQNVCKRTRMSYPMRSDVDHCRDKIKAFHSSFNMLKTEYCNLQKKNEQ